jgi:ubiquinone/menaquinone biosynthesis C-methylase UbiE
LSEHNDRVREEFARQAPEFEAKHSFFGDSEIAEWIGAHLPLAADDSVLDVCGGAGHLSRRLADGAAPRMRAWGTSASWRATPLRCRSRTRRSTWP